MAAGKMSIDSKPQPPRRHDSEDSGASSPEREQNPVAPVAQDQPQPKRKGGRKPIYATSEERKQRNRQAQAAFRERRTEYIKQLEETIRIHESNLHNLQTAHRTAADECLMLRYKNSLLERILLEKGIDVHAELQAKTGSPTLGPTHMPQNLVQPPPIQRAIMSRHPRKSISAIAPKTEPGTKGRLSVSAASGSPSNTGSGFSPSGSDSLSMRSSISGLTRQQMTPLSSTTSGSQSVMHSRAGAGSFYPGSGQLDHLDEDYEMRGEIDDSELDNPRAAYGSGYGGENSQSMLMSPTSQSSAHHNQNGEHPFPTMTQLLDQNLDWDPFGLSASMAFPASQFQFEHATHMR